MGIATPPPFDNVINTPQPTVIQQETTAATDLARQGLGIVPHNTFQTFTEVNKHTLWKYDSNAGKPILPPLSSNRTGGANEIDDMAWQLLMGAIVATLPQEIQERLANLHKLNPEERNSASFDNYDSWKALDELIKFAAKSEYFITYASELSRSENLVNESVLNSELPSIVSQNMVKEAEELAEMLKQELKEQLLNHPEKDACTYILSRFEALIQDMPSQIARAA